MVWNAPVRFVLRTESHCSSVIRIDEAVGGDPGVVHEQLDGPEGVFDLAERAVDGLRVGHRGLDGERFAARRLDGRLRLLRPVVVGRVAERDPMARLPRARRRRRDRCPGSLR